MNVSNGYRKRWMNYSINSNRNSRLKRPCELCGKLNNYLLRSECTHGFCYGCLVDYIQNKEKNQCPVCHNKFKKTERLDYENFKFDNDFNKKFVFTRSKFSKRDKNKEEVVYSLPPHINERRQRPCYDTTHNCFDKLQDDLKNLQKETVMIRKNLRGNQNLSYDHKQLLVRRYWEINKLFDKLRELQETIENLNWANQKDVNKFENNENQDTNMVNSSNCNNLKRKSVQENDCTIIKIIKLNPVEDESNCFECFGDKQKNQNSLLVHFESRINQELKQKIKEFEEKLQTKDHEIKEVIDKNTELEEQLHIKENQIKEFIDKNKDLNQDLDEIKAEWEVYDSAVEKKLNNKQIIIKKLVKRNQKLSHEFRIRDEFIEDLSKQLGNVCLNSKYVMFGSQPTPPWNVVFNSKELILVNNRNSGQRFSILFRFTNELKFCNQTALPYVILRPDSLYNVAIREGIRMSDKLKGWFDSESEDPSHRYIMIGLSPNSLDKLSEISLKVFAFLSNPNLKCEVIDEKEAKELVDRALNSSHNSTIIVE